MCEPSAAVIGLSATMPAGAASVDMAWSVATTGSDTIGEVPAERWDVGTMLESSDGIMRRRRHGGFVVGVDSFANNAFGVSSAEAAVMDPQQRLLLEHGYNALHSGQMRRAALQDSLTAVFVGITFLVFEETLLSSPHGGSVFAATGSGHSIASGRLSYVLGTHGPCLSIETACSAALAACHSASTALRRTECCRALAMGVNLMLSPVIAGRFGLAGMTSPHGRCATLDARADGYARAEACGGVTLGSKDGDGATLCGSSIRQDGRSASLTAPNGQAQRGLLIAARKDAGETIDALTLNEPTGHCSFLVLPSIAGTTSRQ